MQLSIGVINMLRHQENNNLTLYRHPLYRGLSVQVDKAPFIKQYLDRLYTVSQQAVDQYPRVFAFRFDLRIPASSCLVKDDYKNSLLKKFMSSFKAKIKHNRDMARKDNKYAHDSTVRYVWAREIGQHGKPHYHLVVFLNYDAFCTVGKYELGRDNIFNRLLEAWAVALGLPVAKVTGLVEIPKNAYYKLTSKNSADLNELDSFGEFFFRASYLCKAATKTYGDGQHGFGASRT